ncbi:permease-like cell division protein FtsX [Dactylosporangium sp. NPDC005555]|uniref:permease-like cell division protein FtsX n=1 Tax=Dactylosporangium sp. NPDC005555 TaxID=3154889 RepID=UPI0033BF53C2
MTRDLQDALRAEYELAHDTIRPEGVAAVRSGAARKRRRKLLAGTAALALALAGGAVAWRLAPGDDPAQQVAGGECDRPGVDVSVFLKVDITAEQEERLEQALRDSPEVYCLAHVSREAAWEDFKVKFSDAPKLVAATRADSVAASFRFRVAEQDQAGTVEQRLHAVEGISDYICQRCRPRPS